MVLVDFNQRGISLEAKKRVLQRPSEKIIYTLLMSKWALVVTGTPTILKVVDIIDSSVNLESTLFPSGAATEDNNEIVLPIMQDLTVGKTYRVHVNFTDGTNTFEDTFLVECKN